jgi:hypothetical protein
VGLSLHPLTTCYDMLQYHTAHHVTYFPCSFIHVCNITLILLHKFFSV